MICSLRYFGGVNTKDCQSPKSSPFYLCRQGPRPSSPLRDEGTRWGVDDLQRRQVQRRSDNLQIGKQFNKSRKPPTVSPILISVYKERTRTTGRRCIEIIDLQKFFVLKLSSFNRKLCLIRTTYFKWGLVSFSVRKRHQWRFSLRVTLN